MRKTKPLLLLQYFLSSVMNFHQNLFQDLRSYGQVFLVLTTELLFLRGRFEFKHNAALRDLMTALNSFGRIRISKTFPALCRARLQTPVTTHLATSVSIATVDYHGNPRTSGCDPVTVELRDDEGDIVPTEIKDNDDGSYVISFTPRARGVHKLCVSIFDRPIRESPFMIDVSEHNNPVLKVGQRGSGNVDFVQPVCACVDKTNDVIYVLDTGNSRIKVLDREGRFLRHVGKYGLEEHSCTGMCLAPGTSHIVLVNWRTKHVTEMNHVGDVVKKFTCSEFQEPTSVAVNSHGDVIVADNGVGKLLVFDANGKLVKQIGSKGSAPAQFKLITSVYCAPNDDILVTDNRLQVFDRHGNYIREISAGDGVKGGQYGGVTVDEHGNVLATRSARGRCVIQVFNPSYDWLFDIDSFDDKLKRPSGLAALPLVTSSEVTSSETTSQSETPPPAVTSAAHVIVADLGNDCVKIFRYQ